MGGAKEADIRQYLNTKSEVSNHFNTSQKSLESEPARQPLLKTIDFPLIFLFLSVVFQNKDFVHCLLLYEG